MITMACPTHGIWPLGGNFCPQCGLALEPANGNCAGCDKPLEPLGANFCRHCGADQRPTKVTV